MVDTNRATETWLVKGSWNIDLRNNILRIKGSKNTKEFIIKGDFIIYVMKTKEEAEETLKKFVKEADVYEERQS